MGESRQDLLAWLSELLQLNNLNKIERMGNGAEYCQVMDSIYGDVPMHKVKFDGKQDYVYWNWLCNDLDSYIANMKVLQDVFKKHKVDKPIPVEALVKCKMQDNLEFTQWLKKFWDAHWPGTEYDAVGRRGGAGGSRGVTPSAAPTRPPVAGRAPAAKRAPVASTSTAGSTTRRPLNASGGTTARAPSMGVSSAQAAQQRAELEALTSQMGDMRMSVDALEKERDFYFGKLREIEIIVAARLEESEGTEPTLTEAEQEVLKRIQDILYQTEEGFEVPDEEGLLNGEEEILDGEEETF